MDYELTEVSAGFTTLMNQGTMTACTWFSKTIEYVDSKFGDGYSKEHPELIGQLVIAASNDCGAGMHGLKMQEIRDALIMIAEYSAKQ